MPRLTEAQWRQLQEMAGMPDETDPAVVFAAVGERLRARRVDPRRRDQVIAAAVAGGKFSVDRVPFYASLWEQDPAGTERLITNLAAVAPPAAGSPVDPGYPDPHGVGDVAHLFPPATREEQEARWRWEDAQAGLSDDDYEALFGPDR